MGRRGGKGRVTKIAIVQMKSSEDKKKNLARSVEFITRARNLGAKLVVFPEFQMAYSPVQQSQRELVGFSERVDGNFVSALCENAKENGIHVLATIYERSPEKNRVYNTAILIGPDGRLRGRYRKVHLYDAFGFRESAKIVAGDEILPPMKTELGKIGVMICYDLRFPEHARLLALGGAQIILVPAGWIFGPMKEDHWLTLLKARAIENGVYVVAAAQVGNIYTGRSVVVDPFGVVQDDLGQGEKLVTVEIDLDRIEEVRRALPLLKNSRQSLYQSTRKQLGPN